MVTTRRTNLGQNNTHEKARRTNLDPNDTHEEAESINPEVRIANLNQLLAQAQKNVEDLLAQNALLQAARMPAPSQHLERGKNSQTRDGRATPSEHPEDPGERAEPRIENNVPPGNQPPPLPTEAERRLQQMVLVLGAKYDALSKTMDQKRGGKESLVDNLFQNKESIFIDEVANFDLPGRFKVLDISVFLGCEDPVEHLDNF